MTETERGLFCGFYAMAGVHAEHSNDICLKYGSNSLSQAVPLNFVSLPGVIGLSSTKKLVNINKSRWLE